MSFDWEAYNKGHKVKNVLDATQAVEGDFSVLRTCYLRYLRDNSAEGELLVARDSLNRLKGAILTLESMLQDDITDCRARASVKIVNKLGE